MEVVLRPWRLDDADSIATYAGDREVARWLRDVFPCPYSRQDAEDFIRMCLDTGEDEAIFRAIEVDGTAVGSVALTRGRDVYRRSAELGYWLGRPFWGRGIVTEAVKEICLLCLERWDIVRIFAEPFAENCGSRRVLEKAGFQLEGTLRKSVYKWGQLQDSCIYGYLRGQDGPLIETTG